MRRDDKVFLLIGDTGFHLVEPLFEEFPDRTLNVGVAEQNLIGISAGLCNAGFKPVCYAISNFLVQRCFEQIRNDLCLHNYPVVLAGTSAGFDNGALWATHYIVDDIGCLKPLPKMKIYSPSSIEAMHAVCRELFAFSGPAYMRIAKSKFSEGKDASNINRFVLETPESEILVVAHGKMVKNAIDAAALAKNFSVFAMDRIKPVDTGVLDGFAGKYKKIVVVEDNFKSGLYNSICQFLAERNAPNPKIYFIGPAEEYEKHTGDPKYLEEKYGLAPAQINAFIKKISAAE